MSQQILKPLHLACGSGEEDPNNKLIGIKNNIATAYNGTLMVKLNLLLTSKLHPEDVEKLNGKLIHAKTWKEIHKCDELTIAATSIGCEVDGIKKTYYFENSSEELFDHDGMETVRKKGEEKQRIVCYDPSQIEIISKIFQQDALNFSFSAKKGATVIFPASESGMMAILQPLEQVELNRYIF